MKTARCPVFPDVSPFGFVNCTFTAVTFNDTMSPFRWASFLGASIRRGALLAVVVVVGFGAFCFPGAPVVLGPASDVGEVEVVEPAALLCFELLLHPETASIRASTASSDTSM